VSLRLYGLKVRYHHRDIETRGCTENRCAWLSINQHL